MRTPRSRRAAAHPTPRLTDADKRRLEETFIRLYSQLGAERRRDRTVTAVPPLTLQFYPYTTLKHTIRSRGGRVLIRISDVLREAPLEILESLLTILVHKLLRRPVPPVYRQVYRRFICRSAVRSEILRVRRARGRKRLIAASGRVFDLRLLYEELNRQYFGNGVSVRQLGWSLKRNRRTLGHYDPVHRTIVINRRLDHPLVPPYVVQYVLYHEMLHALLGGMTSGHRRHFHHRRFRDTEKRFVDYYRARRFIDSEL